jgi:hypothetical protein
MISPRRNWTGSNSMVALALATLLLATLLLPSVGCTRYRLGNCTLYRGDIRTVYVPVARSESFRRHLGERLTEAVVREIESNSSMKVVHTSDADSVLDLHLVSDKKYLLAEDRFDVPRSLDYELIVVSKWSDRTGNPLTDSAYIPVDLTLTTSSSLVPEGGQSLAVSQVKSIQGLARQIVNQMEAGW